MEISATERMMLIKEKETICGFTMEIIKLSRDPQNEVTIKQNFSIILQKLNTIASYSNTKNYDLDKFTEGVNALFELMSIEKANKIWILSPKAIEKACNYANSVRFDFINKKGIKITLPKLNFNFGNITNK